MSRPFFSLQIPIKPLSNPRLNLLGFPLLFNPSPKFLGVPLIGPYPLGPMSNPVFQILSTPQSLRSIATASWGPTKESLSLLYKAFVRPVLTYASPGWFPFLCNTATNHLEVLHRAGSLLVASFPPPPHYSFSRPNSLL